MRIKGAKAVHYEAGPNMTPLVDVVMVLLIFLMLVGKFGAPNRYLVSDMPISSSGAASAPVDPNEIPKEPVVITVTSPYKGKFTAFAGTITSSDPADLSAKVEGLIKAKLAAGTAMKDIQVYIKPARNVRYNNVVDVYSAIVSAAERLQKGAIKIGFQTSEG